MELTFISLATALGWTILYSLWQLLLVALALRLLLLITSKRAATLRYALGLCAMLVAIVWAAFTFYEQMGQVTWFADLQALETAAEIVLTTQSSDVSTVAKKDWSSWRQQVENYLPVLTVLWLIGVIMIGVSTLQGYAQLNRLYRVHTQWIGESWQLRLCQLRVKMGIKRYVELCVSSVLHEPITFRHLRPVILLPVSALTNLTTVQLEVLLLHELAHIRRHDYLVNWIQSCFEVLFFYHPAFWWMSRQVRTAREYCCDDWVLRVNNEPLLYAQTLTQLQFNHLSIKTNLAMTAIKNQGAFTARIHRLFGKYESQNSGRKGVLTAMLLVTALIAFAFYPSVANVEQPAPSTITAVADTSKLPMIMMLLEDSIPKIKIEVEETIHLSSDEKLKGLTGRTLDSLMEERVITLSLSKDFQGMSMDSLAIHGKVDQLDYQVQEYTFTRNADQVDTLIVINPDLPSGKNVNTQVKVTVDKISVIKNDTLPSKVQIIKSSKNPLLIVDGVISEVPLDQITPDHIKFIEVIKGENATKIYGAAAEEGVIIVTTKHDKKTKQKSLESSKKAEQATSVERAVEKNFDFKVYPNPSQGLVQMQLKVQKKSKVKLDIFDQNGKLVKSVADGNIDGEILFTWDTSSVVKGIYTIILRIDGERVNKQLVIQ